MKWAAVLACALAGCPGRAPLRPIDVVDAGTVDAGTVDAGTVDAGTVTIGPRTFSLTLDHGAFPPSADHPSAVVYIPPGFDPAPPRAVVVYLHPFNNCAENVVRDVDGACAPGGAVRPAFDVIGQVDRSGKNVMLIVPQLAFDEPSADPGTLADDGGFRALLAETLDALAQQEPALAPSDFTSVGEVIVVSHLAGYAAAAGIATRGGVALAELHLVDSLFGFAGDFDAWVELDEAGLVGSPPARRFGDFFTAGGGTANESFAMAARAVDWAQPDAGTLVVDESPEPWPDELIEHGLVFKESELSVDDLGRTIIERILRTSANLRER